MRVILYPQNDQTPEGILGDSLLMTVYLELSLQTDSITFLPIIMITWYSSRNASINDELVCSEGCKAYKRPQHQRIYLNMPNHTYIYSNIQKHNQTYPEISKHTKQHVLKILHYTPKYHNVALHTSIYSYMSQQQQKRTDV